MPQWQFGTIRGVKLDTYANVKANLSGIQSAVFNSNSMPPRNPLDSGTKQWLRTWLDEGAPQFAPGSSETKSDGPLSQLLNWLIPSVSAADFTNQKAQSDFFAIGKPSMLKVHGKSTDLAGKVSTGPKGISGKLIAKMDQFTTGGMALRDKHLKEKVFETGKFPTSEITFTDLAANADGAPFKGKLKFHGVEKDVEGTVKISDRSKTDKLVTYDVAFKVKLTDFGVEPPSYLGMSIQNDVDVTVKGEAKQ